MKRWALILPGGGAGGAWQVGMARSLFDAGLIPSFIVGTSAGALNAAGLSYVGPEKLEAIWRSIQSEADIFTGHYWAQYPFENGMKNADPLRAKISGIATGNTAKIPFYVTGTQMLPKKPKIIVTPHTDPNIIDWVTASARIPAYVDPYTPPGFCVCDGGVMMNVPVPVAAKLGAEVCVVLQTGAQDPDLEDGFTPNGIVGQFIRAFSLCSNKLDEYEDAPIVPEFNCWAKDNSVGDLDFTQAKIGPAIDGGKIIGLSILDQVRSLIA